MQSFILVAPESDFPIQNLPYGVFQPRSGGEPRVGTAIGEFVLDLAMLEARGLLPLPGVAGGVFCRPSLNTLLSLGRETWSAVRQRLTQLLREDEPTLRDDAALRNAALIPQADVKLLLPVEIPDYTDFYSSLYHATNVGTMIRGEENALQPNWRHLPVAYHGRASSVVVSGTPVRRPCGQRGAGDFGPSRSLDFEVEMGFFIGPGSTLGEPIPIARSGEHIFGMVLVNDWSARDIQKWEYVPLGPFLSKSFATSISPWVVTMDALAPFRLPKAEQEPQPLPYLQWADDRLYDVQIDTSLQPNGGESGETGASATGERISSTNTSHLYWTAAQQLAHQTINGCNLRTGDLLASGTISGPEPGSRGCLLELTWRGEHPLQLAGGLTRKFLEDGDTLTMTAFCQGDGYRVGFGDVAGRVLPANA
jgi:fumarylacetoacetase